MKKLFIALLIAVLYVGPISMLMAEPTSSSLFSASQSDKYDGDCAGTETTGRCADKCPPSQFVRGLDKDTGAAICGSVTGCPYGDSVPLGPECDKLAPTQQEPEPIAPIQLAPPEMEFVGK